MVHNSLVLSVISYVRRCRCLFGKFVSPVLLNCLYALCYASIRSSNLQTFSFFASFDTCRFVTLLHIFVSPEGTSLLSVERAVNCLLQVSNGYTPKERLEGLHFEAGNFHAGIKFMQVSKTYSKST